MSETTPTYYYTSSLSFAQSQTDLRTPFYTNFVRAIQSSAAMAEVVAGLLASAFVSIAKDKLGSAIAEQASLLWNFTDDLEEMKDHLETISAALEDAERRSVKEKLVQLLLKRLKDVALDISDVLEDYQDTSDQATAKVRSFTLLYSPRPKTISI